MEKTTFTVQAYKSKVDLKKGKIFVDYTDVKTLDGAIQIKESMKFDCSTCVVIIKDSTGKIVKKYEA